MFDEKLAKLLKMHNLGRRGNSGFFFVDKTDKSLLFKKRAQRALKLLLMKLQAELRRQIKCPNFYMP